MGKNVIPFPRRQGVPDAAMTAGSRSRVTVRVGRQQYVIDISCTATALPPDDLAADHRPAVPQVETKFLRLRNPAKLGESDRWLARVLARWLGSRQGLLRGNGGANGLDVSRYRINESVIRCHVRGEV